MRKDTTRTIKVRKYNLAEAKQADVFKKWKMWVCKIIKVPVLHRYHFIYNINYNGVQLKADDVIINQQGVAFGVHSAGKGMATIVTHKAFSEQPQMKSVFHLLVETETEKEAKLKQEND